MTCKAAGDKGISKIKSKQLSPCNNCTHQPVTSWGNACTTCIHKPVRCMQQPVTSQANACCTCMHKPVRCMHQPVTSQADACTYCMVSKVSSLSRIYLFSTYFVWHESYVFIFSLFPCLEIITQTYWLIDSNQCFATACSALYIV